MDPLLIFFHEHPQMDSPVNSPPEPDLNDRKAPKKNSKKFVLVLTFFSAIGGFLFGYDTGVVSGALLLLKREFKLTVLEQEIFVSVTIACACLFSLFGGYLNDKVGRRWTTIIASIAFTGGALILGLANGITLLMIGRAFLGFGIGKSMKVMLFLTYKKCRFDIFLLLLT